MKKYLQNVWTLPLAVALFFASAGCSFFCSSESSEVLSQCMHEWAEGEARCVKCGEGCDHLWDETLTCQKCSVALDSTVKRMDCHSENGNIYGCWYLPDVYYGRLRTVIVSHGYNVISNGAMATLLAKRGYAAYAFDFCGGSPMTRSDMAMEDMTVLTEKADLLSVFDMVKGTEFVDTDQIYLYGESQGGLVSSLASVELANDVAGLVLMYPGFSAVSELATRFAYGETLPERIDFLGRTLKKGYAEALLSFLPKGYEKVAQEDMTGRLMLTKELYAHVARYKGKTLVFHGAEDDVVPIEFSRLAVKYYSNARLVEWEGQKHGFSGAEFVKTADLIDRFIKDLHF